MSHTSGADKLGGILIADTRDLRRALSSTSPLSLRYVVSIYCDFIDWKSHDGDDDEKMFMTRNIEELLQYNAYDALLTRRAFAAMMKELHSDD